MGNAASTGAILLDCLLLERDEGRRSGAKEGGGRRAEGRLLRRRAAVETATERDGCPDRGLPASCGLRRLAGCALLTGGRQFFTVNDTYCC